MIKIRKTSVLLAFLMTIGMVSMLEASPSKGQKIFVKKMKDGCGFAGDKFAVKHTQTEWEEIYNNGTFKEEMKKICPNLNTSKIKDKWLKHLYDFSYEYASDSGNVPSC